MSITSRGALVKASLNCCNTAFVRRGFTKAVGGGPVLELSQDFLLWIGLNRGGSGLTFRINPFVGVHSIPIMSRWAEIGGVRYKLGSVSTFAEHLGEFAPEADVFEFTPDTNLESEARRMVEVIVERALPRIRTWCSLDALIEKLLTRTSMLGGYPERVAIAYQLSGQPEKCVAFIGAHREYLRKECPTALPAWDEFEVRLNGTRAI